MGSLSIWHWLVVLVIVVLIFCNNLHDRFFNLTLGDCTGRLFFGVEKRH